MVVWVRRVRTGSGATAVQIVESVNGQRCIVGHVGSAHDQASLDLVSHFRWSGDQFNDGQGVDTLTPQHR